MERVVSLVRTHHRLMFEVLAGTGLRRSELLALEVRHLALKLQSPHVKVRQRVRRQRRSGLVIGPLKSRHARRDIPIGPPLADRLATHVVGRGQRDLVFRSTVDTILDPDNIALRVLAPACTAAGVGWAGFHTFRHTVASRLFAEGRNVVQVQRWLGHHSPSFTLDTYVHLLDGDLGTPLAPLTTNQTTNNGRKQPQTAGWSLSPKATISRTNAKAPAVSATTEKFYGTEGREFESLRARQEKAPQIGGVL
jgi:integrase